MISGNTVLDVILAAVVVGGLIAIFSLRRHFALRRILKYTGGTTPETMDFGVIFFGYSNENGRIRPRKGALFATSKALVFVSLEYRSEILEIPWTRLAGWHVIGQFRGRPLDRKVLALRIHGEVGAPVDAAFAAPRPEFWTSLIDIALKSGEKDGIN